MAEETQKTIELLLNMWKHVALISQKMYVLLNSCSPYLGTTDLVLATKVDKFTQSLHPHLP